MTSPQSVCPWLGLGRWLLGLPRQLSGETFGVLSLDAYGAQVGAPLDGQCAILDEPIHRGPGDAKYLGGFTNSYILAHSYSIAHTAKVVINY